MYLKAILLKDYRNIASATVIFLPGVNVLYGKNAAGKTNVMEGVYYFAQGRSFRTPREKELIRFDQPFAQMELLFQSENERTMRNSVKFTREGRVCTRAGAPVKKMSEWIGDFRAVLFAPQHLSIVKDGPAERRSFLDFAISQIKPMYVQVLREFNQVLVRRNAMLRILHEEGLSLLDYLHIYTQRLANAASRVAEIRTRSVELLSREVNRFMKEMSGGTEDVQLTYLGGGTAEDYIRRMREVQDREIRTALTQVGVHKEDIGITINGKEARTYASQGQQRSIALAMKLAEGELSKLATGEYPVFLLDDVFSELDESRKHDIMEKTAQDKRQLVLTTCDESVCRMWKDANVYTVEDGVYTQVEHPS